MYIFPETQGEEASDHGRRGRCYHLGSLETWEEEVHWGGQALEERVAGTTEEPQARYLFLNNPKEVRQSISMVPHAAQA